MDFLSNNRLILVLAALGSVLLSVWAIHSDPVINIDGIRYLAAAEEFALGNFGNAMEIYKWPFYSAIIGFVQWVSGVDITLAAHIVNTLFSVACVTSFLACVHALGADRKTLIIAALIILLFPSLNKFRSFIIRDIGFVSVYLWALYFYISALKTPSIWRYLAAAGCMILATLFRIEGVAILLIMPLFLLYQKTNSKRWRCLWALLTGGAAVGLFAGLSVWLFGQTAVNLQRSGSLLDFFFDAMQHAAESLWFKIHTIGTEVLTPLSEQFAPLVLTIAVLLIVAYEPLRRLAFIYAGLAWYAIKERLVLQDKALRKSFYMLFAIQLALLAIFTAINMFLQSRHTLALVLTILLTTPFAINELTRRWKSRVGKRWVLPLIITALLALGLEGLDLKTNKLAVINSGEWIKNNIPANYRIYSNNPLLLHYADRNPAYYKLNYNWQETDWMLHSTNIFDFHYAIFELNKNNRDGEAYISQLLGQQPSQKLPQGRKSHLLVYDLRAKTAEPPRVDFKRKRPDS